jgi:deoxyribonuclease V
MKIKKLHNWNVTAKKAVELQKGLARQVRQRRFNKKLKTIAGIDCAFIPLETVRSCRPSGDSDTLSLTGFTADKKNIIACIVVLSTETFENIETVYAVQPVTFPYIPGLLSFREAPACLAAAEKLTAIPDCFIVDGQGIAHPRRLGIASHLGLFLDVPTIGCAKSRLIGDFIPPGLVKGSASSLMDKDEVVGSVVRTRSNIKPVFVSVSNKCRLCDAVRIVLDCCTKYRLPEPSRLAHQIVTRLKDSKEV